MDRLNSGDVRFELLQAFRTNSFAANVVGQPPFEDPFQLRDFIRGNRDNDFATSVKGDVFPVAEFFHGELAITTVCRA